jgi:hypothetical protein
MTIINKKDLWLRLRNYHFDHIVDPGLWENIKAKFGGADASEKAFAVKIAAKHGWKNRFALKAIAEYKKFIYLGIVSDFLVTPSKVIDVVWHEHILFSKAYRIFCAGVIEQNFDHHPELIPMAGQTGRFSAQYLDTINLYQTEFNAVPPPDIWGDTKFDKEQLNREAYQSAKKKRNNNPGDGGGIILYDDEPALHSYFDDNENYPEFGGGEYGGGGASGDWGDTSGSDSGSGGCSGGCGGGGD